MRWGLATLALLMLSCGQATDPATGAATPDQVGFQTSDSATTATPSDAAPRAETVESTTDTAAGTSGPPARLWLSPVVAGGRLTSPTHTLQLSVPMAPVGTLESTTHRLWLWAGAPRPN